MDHSPSALQPQSGLAAHAEEFRVVARDYARPFSWIYPWLLALTGIAITLLFAS